MGGMGRGIFLRERRKKRREMVGIRVIGKLFIY